MKRITPEMVVEAYIKTGLAPRFLGWADKCEPSACALTTMGCSEFGMKVLTEARVNKFDFLDRLVAHIGRSMDYFSGFWLGFDGAPLSEFGSFYSETREGHQDGAAAREAVLEYFSPKVLPKLVELPAAEEVSEPESVAVAS